MNYMYNRERQERIKPVNTHDTPINSVKHCTEWCPSQLYQLNSRQLTCEQHCNHCGRTPTFFEKYTWHYGKLYQN